MSEHPDDFQFDGSCVPEHAEQPVDADEAFAADDEDLQPDDAPPPAGDEPAPAELSFPDEGEAALAEPPSGGDPELEEWLDRDETAEAVDPEFDAWLKGALEDAGGPDADGIAERAIHRAIHPEDDPSSGE
jgi:hypothetical protein